MRRHKQRLTRKATWRKNYRWRLNSLTMYWLSWKKNPSIYCTIQSVWWASSPPASIFSMPLTKKSKLLNSSASAPQWPTIEVCSCKGKLRSANAFNWVNRSVERYSCIWESEEIHSLEREKIPPKHSGSNLNSNVWVFYFPLLVIFQSSYWIRLLESYKNW